MYSNKRWAGSACANASQPQAGMTSQDFPSTSPLPPSSQSTRNSWHAFPQRCPLRREAPSVTTDGEMRRGGWPRGARDSKLDFTSLTQVLTASVREGADGQRCSNRTGCLEMCPRPTFRETSDKK